MKEDSKKKVVAKQDDEEEIEDSPQNPPKEVVSTTVKSETKVKPNASGMVKDEIYFALGTKICVSYSISLIPNSASETKIAQPTPSPSPLRNEEIVGKMLFEFVL